MPVVMLNKVRIAFANDIFVAKSVNGGDPRYGATFIIEPDSENAKKLKAAMDEVAKAKWKDAAANTLKEIIRKDRTAYGETELMSSAGKVVNGFEGKYYMKAYNKSRPTVIGRNKEPLTQADGKPYSGCYVNATVDVWAQDNPNFGKRINGTLTGVQFHSDGEAFGGGAPADPDAFPDLGVDEKDDDTFF